MDDVLQNNPGSELDKSGVPALETATTVDPNPKPAISSQPSSHPSDDSDQLETTPTSTSPMLRRSSCSPKSVVVVVVVDRLLPNKLASVKF